MPVDEWYCCLAVALDAEEDEAYDRSLNAYISAGGDPKKFPRRPEKTTSPRGVTGPEIMAQAQAAGIPAMKGSLEDYARIRHMQRVFKHADGTFRDESGKVVEPPPGSVYVPVKKH